MTIDYANIPSILREYQQWVLWRYEQRAGQSKPTKVLYNPHTHKRASSTDRATWGTLAQVQGILDAGTPPYDGIGFVVTPDDPFCGIDLDGCFTPETGELTAQAAEIVERMDSYTEITVSGRGLRVWVQGTLPPGTRRRGHVEMYDCARFFTVTGHRFAGSPGEVHSRQTALDAVHQDVFLPSTAPQPSAQKSTSTPLSLTDQEVLHKAENARNGAKFRALYYQGVTDGDASAADIALCNMLAFWTGGDSGAVDRLFRGSALMREKWDKRHRGDGSTYGQMTVARALQDLRDQYAGAADDGYVTLKKAADALGITKQAVSKRIAATSAPTKRTEKGLILVHLESLRGALSDDETTNHIDEKPPTTNQNTANRQPKTANHDGEKPPTANQNRQPEPEKPPTDNQKTANRQPPTANQATDDDAVISNNTADWIQTEKGSKLIYAARRLRDIYEQVVDVSGGWPRRVGGMLFFDRDGEIQFMEKHPDLFSWLADYGALSWRTGLSHHNESFPTKEELFSYTLSHSELYDDIASYPHEPTLPGFYYSWRPIDYTPTGEYFEELLAFFTNVESHVDALMIRAMFMLPAWGGPLKERPAFAITAPDRGCGKTTLADAVGMLYGGLIDINLSKRAEEEILQRLLTPAARLQRIVRLDNIKGEVNSPLLDSLITTTQVSGKQMYKGEARRPNILVYLLTGNGLRLSRDMAERCFIIHLAKPTYMSDWQHRITSFINRYQQHILMDIVHTLRQPPTAIDVKDRWMPFVQEILSRCSDEVGTIIATVLVNQQRRGGSDTDLEEADILLEAIKGIQGEFIGKGWYFVPRNAAVTACNEALNTRMPTRTVLAILREHVNAGRMHGALLCDQKLHGGRRGLSYLYNRDDDLFSGADGAEAGQ